MIFADAVQTTTADEIRKMADAEPERRRKGGSERCAPRCERVWFSMSLPFFA